MTSTHYTTSQAEGYLQILSETPNRLNQIKGQVEMGSLDQPVKDGWSPAQVLGHLHACQDVWGHTIFLMLMHADPAMPKVHPNLWAESLGYFEEEFAPLLASFRLQRARLLKVLSELDDDAWQRQGAIGGRTHTVFSQARRLAEHEEKHWQQLGID